MNLHFDGVRRCKFIRSLKYLTLLANGWVYGTHPRKGKLRFYHEVTGEIKSRHQPHTLMRKWISAGYLRSNERGGYILNRKGRNFCELYRMSAQNKGIELPDVSPKSQPIEAHAQLGRPPRQRGPIWDRGFAAGSTGESCPYDEITKQSRGYAKIWRAGNDAAKRQLVSPESAS